MFFRPPGFFATNVAALASGVISYDAASVTFFDAMDVEPSTAVKDAVDALVVGLKADGVWDDLDVLWPMAMHDAQAARLNIKAPASFALTAVNSPTFTAYRGYAGNGSTSYLNTNWDAATNGVQFTQNSASFGCWIDAGTDSAAFVASMGAENGSGVGSLIFPWQTGSTALVNVNSGQAHSPTLPTNTRYGFTAAERTSSTNVEAFKNGASMGTRTDRNSQSLLDTDIFVGAYSFGGSPAGYLNNRISAVFMGKALGATKQDNLYDRLNTFRTAMAAIG